MGTGDLKALFKETLPGDKIFLPFRFPFFAPYELSRGRVVTAVPSCLHSLLGTGRGVVSPGVWHGHRTRPASRLRTGWVFRSLELPDPREKRPGFLVREQRAPRLHSAPPRTVAPSPNFAPNPISLDGIRCPQLLFRLRCSLNNSMPAGLGSETGSSPRCMIGEPLLLRKPVKLRDCRRRVCGFRRLALADVCSDGNSRLPGWR